jgi:hypothetical protein
MNYVKTPIADILGGLLADIADAKIEADAVKANLIGMAAQDPNVCAFEGNLFRATVTFGVKKVVDYKAIIAALVPADAPAAAHAALAELVKQHTSIAEGVPTVRCSARKGV